MTAAAGSISLAEEYLRTTLANSASWQAATDTATAAEALDRIHADGLPAPVDGEVYTRGELEGHRPYAVVFTSEQQGFSKITDAMSDHHEFNASGSLRLRVVRDSPDSAGDEPTLDANRTFKNLLGQIIDDLCGLAGQAGYLAITKITLTEGPYWPPPDQIETEGLWQAADLVVEW